MAGQAWVPRPGIKNTPEHIARIGVAGRPQCIDPSLAIECPGWGCEICPGTEITVTRGARGKGANKEPEELGVDGNGAASAESMEAEKKELFLTMLIGLRGNVAEACRASLVARGRVDKWRKNDVHFDTAMVYVRETLVDRVEQKLLDLTDVLDGASIRYFLDAQGKSRGYGGSKKVEVGGIGGGPLATHMTIGVGPPEPETLAEWENMVREARAKRLLEEGDAVTEGAIVTDTDTDTDAVDTEDIAADGDTRS